MEKELGSFGPGWFYNILGISVEFHDSIAVVDDGEVFAIPWFSFNRRAILFTGSETILKGQIKLTTYNNNREIWHGGVIVTVEEYIHTLDPYVSVEVKNLRTIITNEELVKGSATYNFTLPLSVSDVKGKISPYCRKDWCNTYNGNTFGIRHVFHVEVIRPWYTFNCQSHTFLSIHRMERIKQQPNNKNSLTINISGLNGNGKCALKLTSNCLDISRGRDPSSYGRGGVTHGGAISGTLRVSDLSDPIISAVLVLLRRESVGNNVTNERVELAHTLVGYEWTDHKITESDFQEEVPRDNPKSRGYWERLDIGDENPRETDPIRQGSVISFEIPLDGYTNLSDDSGSIRGFSISGEVNSHQRRLQHSLWNNIRIHPTFAFIPLLAPPGEEITTEESNNTSSMNRSDEPQESMNDTSNSIQPASTTLTVHSVLPEESVSLRYFLRLYVQEESGKRLWSTQELHMYDSGLSALPPSIDLVQSGGTQLESV